MDILGLLVVIASVDDDDEFPELVVIELAGDCDVVTSGATVVVAEVVDGSVVVLLGEGVLVSAASGMVVVEAGVCVDVISGAVCVVAGFVVGDSPVVVIIVAGVVVDVDSEVVIVVVGVCVFVTLGVNFVV